MLESELPDHAFEFSDPFFKLTLSRQRFEFVVGGFESIVAFFGVSVSPLEEARVARKVLFYEQEDGFADVVLAAELGWAFFAV